MSYRNANELLPAELLVQIQKYVDGGYIYIPRPAGKRAEWGAKTSSREELRQRNEAIYAAYQGGEHPERLSEGYYLSLKSVYRILRQMQASHGQETAV